MSKTKNEKESLSGAALVRREAFDWVETFAGALFLVVLIFTFLFRFVTVDGDSMRETLHDGDRLVITSLPYTPARGDIVVVHDPDDPLFTGPIIKRVIATAGETVRVDYENRTIYVTGLDGETRALDESGYAKYIDRRSGAETAFTAVPNPAYYPASVRPNAEHTVADGCVFACGDNRNNSLDSRYVGDIDARKVLGKVLVRVTPLSQIGAVDHVHFDN